MLEHMCKAPTAATLRRRSSDGHCWEVERRQEGEAWDRAWVLRGCPSLSQTIDAVALLNKFISVVKAGILMKCF